MQLWITIAAANAFIAIAAGAFGAHGLQGRVGDRALAAFETGAQYHMYHALALLAVASLTTVTSHGAVNLAGWAFLAGVVLFSGSLYYFGLTESRALVLITPIGGVAFLAGWAALAWAGLRAS